MAPRAPLLPPLCDNAGLDQASLLFLITLLGFRSPLFHEVLGGFLLTFFLPVYTLAHLHCSPAFAAALLPCERSLVRNRRWVELWAQAHGGVYRGVYKGPKMGESMITASIW